MYQLELTDRGFTIKRLINGNYVNVLIIAVHKFCVNIAENTITINNYPIKFKFC